MVDKFRSIWYHSFAFKKCGCSSVVELQPSKLAARVRFPSPAPFLTGFPLFFYFGLGNLCSNLVAFSLTRKILPFSQKLAFASFLPIRSALGAFPFTRSIFNRVSPVFLFRAWEPLFEFGRLFAYAQNSPFLSETCLRFLSLGKLLDKITLILPWKKLLKLLFFFLHIYLHLRR